MARPHLIFVLVTALPLASASGVLERGPLVVSLDNGFASDCVESLTGLCPATLRGDSFGTMELDADQEVAFVGVAVNDTWVEERVGLELLPGGELFVVRPSSYAIPVGIYRPLIDQVGTFQAPAPVGSVGVWFTEEGWSFTILPQGAAPNGTLPPIVYGYGREYDDSEEADLFERDRIRLQQEYADVDSDHAFAWAPVLCHDLDIEACETAAGGVQAAAEGATPNVMLGLHFVELAAGTDAAFGQGSEAGLAREGAPLPLMRSSLPAAPVGLSRGIPDGARLSRSPPAVPSSTGDLTRPPAREPSSEVSATVHAGAIPHPESPLPVVAAAITFALAVALASLYSRLTRERTLNSATRERLLDALRAEGGQNVSALAARFGFNRKTVEYHVRILERAGELRTTRAGRALVVHLPTQSPTPERSLSGASLRVLDALRERGGCIVREELHQACATIPLRTRNRALRVLVEAGLVERMFEGNRELVRATRTDRAVLQGASSPRDGPEPA